MLTTIDQPTKFYKYRSKVYALVEEQDSKLLLHNGHKSITKRPTSVTYPTMEEVLDELSNNPEFQSICEMYEYITIDRGPEEYHSYLNYVKSYY